MTMNLIGLFVVALLQSPASPVVDARDQQRYGTIAIAGTTWMTRNLAYDAEGSVCPQGRVSCDAEGRLYRWELAMTSCPAGWHVATEEEWQGLERALGMAEEELTRERERGVSLGELLKPGGRAGLDFPLAGWRRPDGSFRVGNGNDVAAAIWTGTRAGDGAAWHRDLSSARTGIYRSAVPFGYSLSVRCARDHAR